VDFPPLSIDDTAPLPVRRPATAAELCALVREAAASGQGVYPVGGRTALDVGLPPLKPGFAVETTALDGVIDYPARDMTITVEAGITLAKLQATLATENQWLPVDVPHPDRATLGGAVALNQSGPRRYGYGTLRDYVIGISFVTDDGDEVKAGGRVVKNVAGYDLMKLHTGAVGTLGAVTRLTLKVKPRPEAMALVTFACGSNVSGLLDRLHESKSRPVAVQLLNPAAARRVGLGRGFGLVVGFEEKAATVEWQVATLLAELAGTPAIDPVELRAPDADRLWAALNGLQACPESRLIFKVSTRPSRVASYFARSAAGGPDLLFAEALSGIVWGAAADGDPAEAMTPDRLESLIHSPSGTADGAHVTVRRCPPAWKATLPVWGRPAADRELMRHVKRTLDPGNVFNPGRLFGDL